MPFFYGFDMTYLVLVLPCIILSLWASSNVKNTFNRYSTQHSIRRITGAQAAQRVLSANGVTGVRIERVSGDLTDHYDPPNQCDSPIRQRVRLHIRGRHWCRLSRSRARRAVCA